MAQEDELTKVLESLVNDSKTLKRDNAELQRLLTESREDLRRKLMNNAPILLLHVQLVM